MDIAFERLKSIEFYGIILDLKTVIIVTYRQINLIAREIRQSRLLLRIDSHLSQRDFIPTFQISLREFLYFAHKYPHIYFQLYN